MEYDFKSFSPRNRNPARDRRLFAKELRGTLGNYVESTLLVNKKGKPVDPEAEQIKGSLLRRGSQRVLSWFAPLYRGML